MTIKRRQLQIGRTLAIVPDNISYLERKLNNDKDKICFVNTGLEK